MESLITLDKSENYNFEENEKATRHTGVHFRILQRRYMNEQKETLTMATKQHNLLQKRRTRTQ